jgi:hypothetical protein
VEKYAGFSACRRNGIKQVCVPLMRNYTSFWSPAVRRAQTVCVAAPTRNEPQTRRRREGLGLTHPGRPRSLRVREWKFQKQSKDREEG